MIKLSENRTALMNLNVTIQAIEKINKLIVTYSEDKPGPAYCNFEYVDNGVENVQFERKIMVEALKKQREYFSDYMKSLGIDIDN